MLTLIITYKIYQEIVLNNTNQFFLKYKYLVNTQIVNT